jgi:hypothetical protein
LLGGLASLKSKSLEIQQQEVTSSIDELEKNLTVSLKKAREKFAKDWENGPYKSATALYRNLQGLYIVGRS